jgi:hypothetical protein
LHELGLAKKMRSAHLHRPRGIPAESNPKAELAEIEKEEIDAYYGYFVPLHRTSDIKEVRPEDALNRPGLSMSTATVDEFLLHSEAHSGGARI